MTGILGVWGRPKVWCFFPNRFAVERSLGSTWKPQDDHGLLTKQKASYPTGGVFFKHNLCVLGAFETLEKRAMDTKKFGACRLVELNL